MKIALFLKHRYDLGVICCKICKLEKGKRDENEKSLEVRYFKGTSVDDSNVVIKKRETQK